MLDIEFDKDYYASLEEYNVLSKKMDYLKSIEAKLKNHDVVTLEEFNKLNREFPDVITQGRYSMEEYHVSNPYCISLEAVGLVIAGIAIALIAAVIAILVAYNKRKSKTGSNTDKVEELKKEVVAVAKAADTAKEKTNEILTAKPASPAAQKAVETLKEAKPSEEVAKKTVEEVRQVTEKAKIDLSRAGEAKINKLKEIEKRKLEIIKTTDIAKEVKDKISNLNREIADLKEKIMSAMDREGRADSELDYLLSVAKNELGWDSSWTRILFREIPEKIKTVDTGVPENVVKFIEKVQSDIKQITLYGNAAKEIQTFLTSLVGYKANEDDLNDIAERIKEIKEDYNRFSNLDEYFGNLRTMMSEGSKDKKVEVDYGKLSNVTYAVEGALIDIYGPSWRENKNTEPSARVKRGLEAFGKQMKNVPDNLKEKVAKINSEVTSLTKYYEQMLKMSVFLDLEVEKVINAYSKNLEHKKKILAEYGFYLSAKQSNVSNREKEEKLNSELKKLTAEHGELQAKLDKLDEELKKLTGE